MYLACVSTYTWCMHVCIHVEARSRHRDVFLNHFSASLLLVLFVFLRQALPEPLGSLVLVDQAGLDNTGSSLNLELAILADQGSISILVSSCPKLICLAHVIVVLYTLHLSFRRVLMVI